MKAPCRWGLTNNEGAESRLVPEHQQWKLKLASSSARSHESVRKEHKYRASVFQVRLLLSCGLALLLRDQALGLQTETPEVVSTSQPIGTTFSPLDVSAAGSLSEAQTPQLSNSSKLKPVNFSLVDELFESSLDDNQVVQHWRRMDNQLRDGMRSILKMVFPQIVAISQDAKVSGDCSGGILKWILSLRNLRSWAIKSKFV